MTDLSGRIVIEITGDSNDSNLVLNSASATISESAASTDLSPLAPLATLATSTSVASVKTDVASVKTDVASVKTDVASVKTDVASVKSVVDSNTTHLGNILTKLNTFGAVERDQLDVIKDRGYIRFGYANYLNVAGLSDTKNIGLETQTSEGWIPSLAKAVTASIFGDANMRVVDGSGTLVKSGNWQIVGTTTSTRFQQLVNDEFDVCLHFPTQTIDRTANQGVLFTNAFGNVTTRNVCRTHDISGLSDVSKNDFLEVFKEIAKVNNGVRYGTADNCTALVFGQAFKQQYPDISMTLVIGKYGPGDVSNGVIDTYTSDGWFIVGNAKNNPVLSAVPAPPSGSVLDFKDFYGMGLKIDQRNNKLHRLVNVVLSTVLKATELDVSSGNVSSFTEPAASSALNNLLFGKNIGGSVNSYVSMGMVHNAGVKILEYGNMKEFADAVDLYAGEENNMPKLVPSYGLTGIVPNSA
jgi:hypothetical protein